MDQKYPKDGSVYAELLISGIGYRLEPEYTSQQLPDLLSSLGITKIKVNTRAGPPNEQEMTYGADQLLDMREATEFLGISRPTLLKYIRLGTIEAAKPGKGWKILGSELYRFLGKDIPPEAGDPLLNTEDARSFLRISRPAFLNLIHDKKINAKKVGRGWKVYKSVLFSYLRGE